MSGVQSTTQQRVNYAPACKLHGLDFLEAYQAKDAVFKVWSYPTDRSWTGCFACRAITGGTNYSLHAYRDDTKGFRHWDGTLVQPLALAEDVNAAQNPYGKRLVTDRPRGMVDDLLAIRTKSGARVFGWGGYYSGNKDAMHDDIVCIPADLASGIDWNTVRGSSPTPVPPEPIPEEEDEMKIKFFTCQGAFTTPDRRGEWVGNGEKNADNTVGITGLVVKTNGVDVGYVPSWGDANQGNGNAAQLLKDGFVETEDFAIVEKSPTYLFELMTNGGLNPAALEAWPSLAGTTPSGASAYAKALMAAHNKKMGRA